MVQVHLSNYVNTIVFCLLASSASLLLLFLMYSTKGYVPYLLTAELGILAIVAYTVGVLLNTVSDTNTDAKVDPTKIDGCPDYYTRDATKGCVNRFVAGDGATYQFTSKVGGTVPAFAGSFTLDAVKANAAVCSDKNYNELPWSDLAAACAT